jgi:hypothetical protein
LTSAAGRAGELQVYAQLRGRTRPVNDSWIAASRLRPAAGTFNVKDFAEHKGLAMVRE